jgi:hypothetical protein
LGPKRDKIIGGWRRMHNEELHNLYSSPNVIRTIKSRVRWYGNVASVEENGSEYRFLVGKSEGKNH